MPVAEITREYVCPGEGYVIPRATHLARQAAGFAACRACPLRDDAPQNEADRPPQTALRRLFQIEGVRGVYRNELDAATAERLATALAAMLWEDAAGNAPAKGFPVVVAHDDRPWSLPLAVAAGNALRRSGCETIDIGFATAPAFRFAVAHLDAAAGILATGAGGGPALAGFDFALAAGRPLSRGGGLDRLADLAERPPGRPTRHGGGRRVFDASAPYDISLKRHFRSFAPRSGVAGCSSPLILGRIDRLAAELRVPVRTAALPRRAADDAGTDPAALNRLGEGVLKEKADFGFWIDESGTACRAIDESGRVVSVADFAALLLDDAVSERPSSAVALDWPLAEQLRTAIRTETVRGNGTAEAMVISLRDHSPSAGADSAGRFWLPGPPPATDALVTLARLLRVIATGEEPLSRRVETGVGRG